MNGASRYGASIPSNNQYTRSEGTNVGEVPPTYYSSNIYNDPADDSRRNPRSRPAEEDLSKSYTASGRGMGFDQHQNSFSARGPGGSDGYGSFQQNGFPNYAPPPPHVPRY